MLAMSKWFTPTPFTSNRYGKRVGFFCRADSVQAHANGEADNNDGKKKKKVVVVGSGWAGLGAAQHLCNQGVDVTVLDGGDGLGSPDNVGFQGFWYPYPNIFSLVDELGIKPFTSWTRSAQYSGEGLEVEFPVYHELPQLPTPLRALYRTQQLPLTTLMLPGKNMIRKYFDGVFCRGTTKEKILEPWVEPLEAKGCEMLEDKKVTDFIFNGETGCITQVVCGKVTYSADAVILAVGIATLQEIIKKSAALCMREEFLKVLNLDGIDVVTVKLQLDRKVVIPNPSIAFAGFDDIFGWTFFDLNVIHDKYKDDPATILEADFYHAIELLPLRDELVVEKVMSYLSKCIKDLESANGVNKEIGRFPKRFTHFFPAANRVVDFLEEGSFAKVIPVEEDKPHIEALWNLNRRLN